MKTAEIKSAASGHGGARKGAGRKRLGGTEKRVAVQIMEAGEKISISLLPAQRDYLEQIGNGNRSAGFRKVLAFINLAIIAYDPLKGAAEIVDRYYGNSLILDELSALCDAIKEITPNETFADS